MRTRLADAGRVAELERRVLLTADFNFTANYNKVGGPVYVLEAPVAVGGVLEGFTGATKGTATLTQINGTPHLRYTPDAGAIGYDTFEAIVRYDDPYGSGSFTYYNNSIEVHIYLPGPSPVDDESFTYDDPNTGSSYYSNYFVLKGNSLTISADDGLLKNDQVGDNSNPLTNLTAIGVTPQNIHIHRGVLPQYGSVSVGGDGSFTYTPFASVFDDPNFSGLEDTFSYYVQDFEGQESETATVKVDLAEIFIARNGTDVDQNALLLEVYVGEEVALTVGSRGEFPTIPGIAMFQWSAGPMSIDSYTGYGEMEPDPDGESVARKSYLSPEELESSSLSLYWIKEGDREVSLTVSCPQLGQSQSDTATFEVSIPSVSVTASVDDIDFGVDADLGPIVHLNGHGMKFERSLDFPPKGAYRWTQLVVHDKVSYTNDGTNWIDAERQGGVDNKVSMSDELEVTNSPALQYTLEGHVGVKRNFKARMYLMWKHNSGNSIWVPLYMTTWKMEFEIEKIGMSWDFVGVAGSAEIIIGPVREWNLPLWERIYRNDDPYVTI